MQTVIANEDTGSTLTRKETREIITPYAFHVSPDLFGTPLASPARRGWSMLIDLALIGLLTQLSSLVLAGVAAFTFFRAGNRLKQKKRFNTVRIFLRFLTAVLLFVVALGMFEEFNDASKTTDTSTNIDFDGIELDGADSLEVLGITAKYFVKIADLKKDIKSGKCPEAYACWQNLGESISKQIDALSFPQNKAFELLNTFVESSQDSLTADQRLSLKNHLNNDYKQRLKAKDLSLEGMQTDTIVLPSPSELTNTSPIDDNKEPITQVPQKQSSIVEAFKEIAEELGWGVGWAAFYFSLFTAWWKGQTPGKRLMGIKVIKLDGDVLNLWESFGRYGGYSAGLATGLSGFLQVYWDPNRQAIQDKISETLVINIRKPKVPFELETEFDSAETEK